MNVLSLFDGMSCGRIALERAGIEVTNYFACEIDKYAIQVSKHNYDDIRHLGDVRGIIIEYDPARNTTRIYNYLTECDYTFKGKFDLIIGGSPCQGFSFAGKQLNFDDPRSKLFFEFVRLYNDIKSQNPEALFFLENVVMKKEYQQVISEHLNVDPVLINSALVSAQNRERLYWTNLPFHSPPADKKLTMQDVHVDALDAIHVVEKYKTTLKLKRTQTRLSVLKTNLKDKNSSSSSSVFTISKIENDTPSGVSRQNDRLYCSNSKSPCLIASNSREIKFDRNSKNPEDWTYITRIEAERLQGVPEGYTKIATENKTFHMLGNGWNVDTIVHFFRWLKIIDEL